MSWRAQALWVAKKAPVLTPFHGRVLSGAEGISARADRATLHAPLADAEFQNGTRVADSSRDVSSPRGDTFETARPVSTGLVDIYLHQQLGTIEERYQINVNLRG
jgi:hypothetical protein